MHITLKELAILSFSPGKHEVRELLSFDIAKHMSFSLKRMLSAALKARRNPRSFHRSMYTVKKSLSIFPSPAGMSLTKLSLAGKILIIPGQGEFGQ
jgi:hypothetical protein